ncbi:AraC family transcriptional regulator [Luteolibacter arcticus]|uniref:AraC family transcriptional regulator n=1 Tax=Luteolibacter arcticus TaxID=1581411 RepID=A0ABT3GFQ2_9BACT|nr:AraC family transcriptional regulator [Luteolibacter arcticus]MCW1922452.1 AraC family transcriptional regulator [Luteolibacter arcticus]
MSGHHWKIWAQQVHTPLGSLVEVGEVVHSSGRMSRFRYLRRYALIVITRGEGHYEDESGRERSLSAGDWILVFPEIGHCYRPDRPGGWDEVYVMFEGPVFEAWRMHGQLDPERPTGRLADPESWLAEFKREMLEENSGSLLRLCAFQKLLAAALEGGGDASGATNSAPAWFADACRLLSRPEADAAQAAHDLGMNYETFRRKFKAHAGVAPHRYHRHQLVNVAARMLDSTDLKSAEIARTLGFSDEAYFSRVFKQVTGRSPRQYRTRQEAR